MSYEKYIWAATTAVLIALSVLWFLWGDARTFVGVPLWIWWHTVWMFVASAVFYVFGKRAWGVGVNRGDGG